MSTVGAGLVRAFARGRRGQPLDFAARGGGWPLDWRRTATEITIFAFIAAFFAVTGPLSMLSVSATTPLWVGFLYVLFGIWTRSIRFLVTGAVLGVLVVIGFFVLPRYFQLWMPMIGRGGLILGGIWMRSP